MSGETLAALVGVLIAVNGFTCIVLCVVMYVRREKFWYDPASAGAGGRRPSLEPALGKKEVEEDGLAQEVQGN